MPASCPACGERIGGKREAQRVDRKKALQTWETLSPTARDTVRFLYKTRLASHWQVGDAIYLDRNESNRKNRAKNVLVHLQKLGLVTRIDGEAKHHHKAFYTLSPEGIFCCQGEEKKGAGKVKKIKALKAEDLLDSQKWRHHGYIVDVLASFSAAERAGQGELLGFWGDGEMSYQFKSPGGRKTLRPDSTILWGSNGQARLCWLEVENRHASLDDFVTKIEKYTRFEKAALGDAYRIQTGQQEFPVILVVGVRRGQLAGLRQSALSGVLKGTAGEALQVTAKKMVVALTCLDDIHEQGLLGKCWEAVLQGHQTQGLVGLEGLFRLR